MSALQILGVFFLGLVIGTLITRLARKKGTDIRKDWGKLT